MRATLYWRTRRANRVFQRESRGGLWRRNGAIAETEECSKRGPASSLELSKKRSSRRLGKVHRTPETSMGVSFEKPEKRSAAERGARKHQPYEGTGHHSLALATFRQRRADFCFSENSLRTVRRRRFGTSSRRRIEAFLPKNLKGDGVQCQNVPSRMARNSFLEVSATPADKIPARPTPQLAENSGEISTMGG